MAKKCFPKSNIQSFNTSALAWFYNGCANSTFTDGELLQVTTESQQQIDEEAARWEYKTLQRVLLLLLLLLLLTLLTPESDEIQFFTPDSVNRSILVK